MSARNEILGRVRAALADVPDIDASADVPVEWTYGQPTPVTDVVQRFTDMCEDYGVTVARCPVAAVPQQIVALLHEWNASSVVLPAGLPEPWQTTMSAADLDVNRDEGGLTSGQLDAIDAVVTAAAVGIAETGTLVLDHTAAQGRRVLTLVPDIHVVVVSAEQIVSDVAEAVARLESQVATGSVQTWISGPSATSDIELSRVEGVHGPRTLAVVIAT